MNYLVRFTQTHEPFRLPELEALSTQSSLPTITTEYSPDSPFCFITFPTNPTDEEIRTYISRSFLAWGIYEFWGQGFTYEELHASVRRNTAHLWNKYTNVSFKFSVDPYGARRSAKEQRDIIDSFAYLGYQGQIRMKGAEEEFVVFEEWEAAHIPVDRNVDGGQDMDLHMSDGGNDNDEDDMKGLTSTTLASKMEIGQSRHLKRLLFGRFVGRTRRHLIDKHNLKKRPYISTTSMDAELALVTANLALAGPDKIFLDPFVGTGGFMIAAAELGALTFGSDIDGRSFKGKSRIGLEKGVGANFKKYNLQHLFGDCFTCDLTNSPLRIQSGYVGKRDRWVDGIIADPPYGVREGLKVLGKRVRPSTLPEGHENDSEDALTAQPLYVDGVLAHTLPGYVAPKRPYSFARMMDDILDFAARVLVDGGRLAFWMPSANEAEEEIPLPKHPLLEMRHICTQNFNKWSRRLLVYTRAKGDLDIDSEFVRRTVIHDVGTSADELNPFRRRYFQGFQDTQ